MRGHEWYLSFPGNFCITCGRDDPIENCEHGQFTEDENGDLIPCQICQKEMLEECPGQPTETTVNRRATKVLKGVRLNEQQV